MTFLPEIEFSQLNAGPKSEAPKVEKPDFFFHSHFR